MNHFFALTLPPELVVRWAEPEDYHLTLNFLGNLSRNTQPRLVKAVSAVPAQFVPFTIHLSFSGAFDSVQSPSVLWAGLNEKRETTRLSKSIDALTEHGFAVDPHSYVPHITLGRCRAKRDNAAAPAIKVQPINLELPVSKFVLLETLPPEKRANGAKARYTLVHTFPFGTQTISDVS